MAIKYLKGNVIANTSIGQIKSFRPNGFDFPRGLKLDIPVQTVDVFLVAGGGGGVGQRSYPGPEGGTCRGGAGGGGGFRLLTGNNFADIVNTESFSFAGGACLCIPVAVGAGGGGICITVGGAGQGGTSCFTPLLQATGGGGGGAICVGFASIPGRPGGSGGGGSRGGTGGLGIAGQGCNGGASNGNPGGGSGGSACATGASNGPFAPTPGISNSFTGAPVMYSCGGGNTQTPADQKGGGGGSAVDPSNFGGPGAAGQVAIRYCNPAAPTTPLLSGGNTVCCTGGCIIHVFTSSGFLCTPVSFPIN
jgi:hypothetical protein